METKTAKEWYDEFMAGEVENNPLERLRFFCSLAMKGQDWLDVEPFFDDIEERIAELKNQRFERNINDEVIVKLTPKGERVYTMNSIYREEPNTNSVYSFQIWDFMSIFGPEIHLGMQEALFENNKLVFPYPERFNIYS